jgi:nucleoside-diphosphate-sugar epimerase
MRVLLSGSSGWLGRFLTPRLRASGHRVLLGFRARIDFAAVLEALHGGGPLPFAHDPDYVSPSTRSWHG